jgi:hypothetical protein
LMDDRDSIGHPLQPWSPCKVGSYRPYKVIRLQWMSNRIPLDRA